jgi:hypothetical protein
LGSGEPHPTLDSLSAVNDAAFECIKCLTSRYSRQKRKLDSIDDKSILASPGENDSGANLLLRSRCWSNIALDCPAPGTADGQ